MSEASASPRPARVLDLGTAGYLDIYERQLELVAARQEGRVGDTLLLVEHPHVITLGRSRKSQNNVVAAGDVEVVQVERGGDATYHGPGQLVAYPIVQLVDEEQDLHLFLRHLEQAMIDMLAEYGLPAGRVEGKTGVWTSDRKIASIGVAVRRWVTFHGLALNVTTDLSYFHRINPCGFDAGIMTSMARELGADVDMGEAKTRLSGHLSRVLGRHFEPAAG